jgi:hypothetical protein
MHDDERRREPPLVLFGPDEQRVERVCAHVGLVE